MNKDILLTKTTAAQNEDALSYHSVRGLYFQAVVFVATIIISHNNYSVSINIEEIKKIGYRNIDCN